MDLPIQLISTDFDGTLHADHESPPVPERLQELIGDRRPLRYIGRARSASPSEGSATWHQMNQKALVERAFSLTSHGSEPSMVLSKPVGSAR